MEAWKNNSSPHFLFMTEGKVKNRGIVMDIGYFCKFPPTAGGEAAKTYYLARGLAERGNIVHIITNAYEVEGEYRERMTLEDYNSFLSVPNLKIHATPQNSVPYYIPQGNPFEIKLANIGLSLIEREGLDVLDSWYLIPNAVAAFMVISMLQTRIPWVIRHAGSDLNRLLPHSLFEHLLRKVLISADKVVTYRSTKDILVNQGVPEEKLWFNDRVSVNTKFFSPEGLIAEELSGNKPIIMSIGKIASVKGTFDLLRSFAPLKDEANLIFVTGGPNLEWFEKEIKILGLESAVKIFPPVPPWRIPSYLRGAHVVVHAERDFPIKVHRPISVRETLACGRCLLVSKEIFAKYHFLKRGENVLTMDPHNHEQFTSQLKFALDNPNSVSEIGRRARETSLEVEDFEGYLDATIELYESMIK